MSDKSVQNYICFLFCKWNSQVKRNITFQPPCWIFSVHISVSLQKAYTIMCPIFKWTFEFILICCIWCIYIRGCDLLVKRLWNKYVTISCVWISELNYDICSIYIYQGTKIFSLFHLLDIWFGYEHLSYLKSILIVDIWIAKSIGNIYDDALANWHTHTHTHLKMGKIMTCLESNPGLSFDEQELYN